MTIRNFALKQRAYTFENRVAYLYPKFDIDGSLTLKYRVYKIAQLRNWRKIY